MGRSLPQAAVDAQQAWARECLAELEFLTDSQRAALDSRLAAAARTVGISRTTRFAVTAGAMTAWGGVFMASLIGTAAWTAQIPTRHGTAWTTAAAYLLVTLSSAVGVAFGSRDFLAYLSRFGDRPRRSLLRLWPALLAMFAVLYTVFDTRAIADSTHAHAHPLAVRGEFTAFVELSVIGLLLGLLAAAAVQADALGGPGGSAASWIGRLLLGIGGGADEQPPLDESMLGLLGVAAAAAGMATGRQRADHRLIRRLIVELEVAATHAQHFASARVPRLDFATRLATDQEGARLAGAIRGLKPALARALRPNDFAKVAVAAAALLTAWTDEAGDGLAGPLADAPDVRRPPWWQRLRGRAGNAALLAAAGLALPELPIYAQDPSAALGARYTLLTAAVLALVTGATPVWDTVSGVLDKATGDRSSRPAE